MNIKIKLKPEEDRVVTLEVTDQYGEIYHVGLEFLNHGFQVDEVQVNVCKILKRKDVNGHQLIAMPNRILYDETAVDIRDPENDHRPYHGMWYEFHEIHREGKPMLPRVVS